MSASAFVVDDKPKPRVYLERIGDKEYELKEAKLDVLKDVVLWPDNPRLQPYIAAAANGISSEEELEAWLRETRGYDALKKSIIDIGQMEPIYVWKRDDQKKYIVYEGATRVAILRELARKGKADFEKVKAKLLPPEFDSEHRAVLLARIHVRGSGVRSWGRYIEAKFVYDHVTDRADGTSAIMSVTTMAAHMEKSVSWVCRLRDAYEFAKHFVEHVDADDAMTIAAEEFSTLEEISKASGIGPKLRDYKNTDYDTLRGEVFDMVKRGAFKEYRDARFIKDFHDDPEKWAALKSGEKGIASKLAAELKTASTSVKAKIAGLEQQIERALERDPESINEEDLDTLRRSVRLLEGKLHPGVNEFRSHFVTFTKALTEASLSDIKSVDPEELDAFNEGMDDFRARREKADKHRA